MLDLKKWTRGAETVPAVDGRELHKVLGVGRDLSTWMASRLLYGYVENVDYCTCLVERGTGTPAKEYLFTLPMAAELALLDRSEKGLELRRFILDQYSVQNCTCSVKKCTESEKAMEFLTLDELESYKSEAQGRAVKAEPVNEGMTDSPWIECLIQREGGVTNTTVGAFGMVITFRPDKFGRSTAKVDSLAHRKQLLSSIFYRQIPTDLKGDCHGE